jgi:hypothetical protein
VLQGGIFTLLDDPFDTDGTFALGINNAGDVTGFYIDATGDHGFVDAAGTFTTLDHPLADLGTVANGINDAGAVAGFYIGPRLTDHAFIATAADQVPEPGALLLLTGGLAAAWRRRKRPGPTASRMSGGVPAAS